MMKTLHRLLKFATFIICCVCVVKVKAQDGFVGDGFGGRSWYQPSNITAGQNVSGSIIKGQLYLWGYGTGDQFGFNDPFIAPIPTASMVNDSGFVQANRGAVKPYAAPGFSNTKMVSLHVAGAAIKADGSGWVWGPNQAGYPRTTTSPYHNLFGKTPIQVMPANQAYYTNAGLSHVAFVKTDGTVWCVGWNLGGCFGTGDIGSDGSGVLSSTSAYTETPIQMKNITNAKRVFCIGFDYNPYAAHTATLVLKGDGTVWIAGAAGVLQSGGTDYLPHQVPGLTNVVDIKGGQDFAMALTATGEVYAWGVSRSTLGNGDQNIYSPAKVYFNPQKVVFPAGTPPIVAIRAAASATHSYAIDEAGTLWAWGNQSNWEKFGNAGPNDQEYPLVSASYVGDVTDGGDQKIAFLTRNNNYPSNQKLWFVGGNATYKISTLAPTYYKPLTQRVLDTGYFRGLNNYVWAPSNPSLAGLPDGIGTFGGDGTINCSKTQLIPAPIQGAASNPALVVTLNVTTTGTFTPVISGSGMSLANANYVINATTTGTQTFVIPLKYDGSTLSSINFKFNEIATGCTITVSGSKPAIVNIITNDCVPTAGPALK